MFKAIFYTHLVSVNLFLLIYLVKTIMLLANKKEGLASFTRMVKVPEMIISTLFLVSGIYLLTQVPAISGLLIIKIVIVLASIPVAVIGFKRANKGLAVLSFLMIVTAYGLAEMNKMRQTENVDVPATTEVNGVNGGEVYVAHCARCHGDDGKLGMSGATDLSTSTLSLAEKMDIIKNGKGGIMPSYVTIGDDQIKAVAEYTETLKK
jgi:mono/diheme cytochrome c family protein